MGGQGFFTSWELWQKMTFILAVLIAIVFGIAYGKLLWMNRLLKKQEAVDEEKRLRVQELRQRGQIVENTKTDIPFGIRAIQSGVQVDGIWISNTSTPVPSELRFDEHGDHRSNLIVTRSSKENASKGIQRRPLSSSVMVSIEPATTVTFTPREDSFGGPCAQFAHDDQQPTSITNGESDEPRPSTNSYSQGDGFYQVVRSLQEEKNRKQLHNAWNYHTNVPSTRTMKVNNDPILYTKLNSAAYSEDIEGIEFDTGLRADALGPELIQRLNMAAPPQSNAVQDHLSPQTSGNAISRRPTSIQGATRIPQGESLTAHDPPQFAYGEIRKNKATRKVNSGFEILPAGTFDHRMAANSTGKGRCAE